MSRLTLNIPADARRGLDFLRKHTGASSDTAAIQNALFIHHTLLEAHLDGAEVLIRKNGTTAVDRVDLFAVERQKLRLVK